jgi:F-type H+-transporting ATPase subunit b
MSFDWTIILQFVNFIVLMAVLNAILYRPMRNMLKHRKETIDGSHERAQELEAQIDEKMARYEEKLQEAKLQGNQEKNQLRQAAAGEEAKILGEARDEATQRLQVVKDQVAGEAEAAGKKLKTDAETLAGDIATKILGRAL